MGSEICDVAGGTPCALYLCVLGDTGTTLDVLGATGITLDVLGVTRITLGVTGITPHKWLSPPSWMGTTSVFICQVQEGNSHIWAGVQEKTHKPHIRELSCPTQPSRTWRFPCSAPGWAGRTGLVVQGHLRPAPPILLIPLEAPHSFSSETSQLGSPWGWAPQEGPNVFCCWRNMEQKPPTCSSLMKHQTISSELIVVNSPFPLSSHSQLKPY